MRSSEGNIVVGFLLAHEIGRNDWISDSLEYIRDRQQRYDVPVTGPREDDEMDETQQEDAIMADSDSDQGQPQS